MRDIEILQVLEGKIGRSFPHAMQGERCVELSLCDEGSSFHGLIRHHTPTVKREVLQLISHLTGLHKLELKRNLLGSLPPEFSQLVELENLNLTSNYLGSIPESIRSLKRLKSLYLGNNDLTELPPWLSELDEIECLALHKNMKLKSIGSAHGLKRLRLLNLYFVSLTELPEFVYGFRNLTTLTLWNTRNFPDGLEALQNLEFFTHCGGPSMRALPKGFSRLKKLRMTRLYQNSLEILPEDFGALENLEQVSLYQNKLTRLPDSMARLQRLTKLNLGWNDFGTFPDWLNNFPNLQWLGVFENPSAKSDHIKCRPGLQIDREWPFSTFKGMN